MFIRIAQAIAAARLPAALYTEEKITPTSWGITSMPIIVRVLFPLLLQMETTAGQIMNYWIGRIFQTSTFGEETAEGELYMAAIAQGVIYRITTTVSSQNSQLYRP